MVNPAEENLEPNDKPGSFDVAGCGAVRLRSIITCGHGQREADEYEGQDHDRQELPSKEFTAYNEAVIVLRFGHLPHDSPLVVSALPGRGFEPLAGSAKYLMSKD
jgi:hypothetical protein